MTMGVSGSFPIDLILFGMIAAFLVLRLRSILGRRTGFERPPQTYQPPQAPPAGPVVPEARPVQAADPINRAIPDPASPFGQALLQMKAVDRNFDPTGFLRGAEYAFRMIVGAFAAGDRSRLRGLLADDTYNAFDQAITAREAEGHTQVSEIRSIQSTAIESAELRGTIATIAVRIVSDQVNLTRDRSGNPVAGTEAVTEISDLWSFERDLAQPDPTWRLVAARSA
jgi:predicted lipid-binding transport protein (Tim44 family)